MFSKIRGHTIYDQPLDSDSLIVDVGANRGDFAKQMSSRYSGTYYLVEANPVLAEALRVEGRFPVLQCAVVAKEGPIQFNIAQNDEGSSILNLPAESVYDCVLHHTMEVQGRKLESVLNEIGAPRTDVLKLDIEGAEVMVLRSLPDIVLRSIGQITVEFHSDPVFGFNLHREVEEVIRYLRARGFLCLDFSDCNILRGDVLFVNRFFYGVRRLQGKMWELRTNPPFWLSRVRDKVPLFLKNRTRWLLDWTTGMMARK